MWSALTAFGAPLGDLRVKLADFTRADTVVQLGLPPARIDLLTGISGVPDFGVAWNGRTEHAVRGRVVPFLGRTELVANKRATGRTKDIADLEALNKSGGD